MHIAQIAHNEAINVTTWVSLAASATLKEYASKMARAYGRRLVKSVASQMACTGLEYQELCGLVAYGGRELR